MSTKEQLDFGRSAALSPRALERLRLTNAAEQMRGLASETALAAVSALIELANDKGNGPQLHAMASVIAREVCQRARNVDAEVTQLVAGELSLTAVKR